MRIGMKSNSIRILGIDPGLRRTGWGIIESDGVRLSYVASGLITSDGDDDLAYRLRELYEGICGVIAAWKPVEAAVEETFVNENARATLKLGQARGMALLAPAMKSLRIAEYQPNLIKKTVVGAVAGVVVSAILAVVYVRFALVPYARLSMGASTAMAFGVLVSVAGQVGDLAESAIKRGAGVKDSGTMLPGHGGMLDRLDSSLFAIPALYALLRLMPR